MPKLHVLSLVAALSGCALNENTLRQEASPLTYTSTNAPKAVAECMAKNMESVLLGAHTAIRPVEGTGGLKVIARGGDDSIYAIGEITSNGKVSSASMWFSQVLHLVRGPQENGMKFMLGC